MCAWCTRGPTTITSGWSYILCSFSSAEDKFHTLCRVMFIKFERKTIWKWKYYNINHIFIRFVFLLQDSKLRQIVTLGSQDTLEEKTVTVCFGSDFVNVSFINFCATRKEIALVRITFYSILSIYFFIKISSVHGKTLVKKKLNHQTEIHL